jgi:hypothetical protein
MSLWTGLCARCPFTVQLGVFPFIYTFNETLAKRKNIEVIEMIPALNTDLRCTRQPEVRDCRGRISTND